MENQKKNDFSLMEEDVLKFWEDNKIFEKSLDKEAPQGEYVFYDGPPFATGTPHYGHIVASLMKDAVPRYWTMRGFRVERKWGWDCHGLPIENIVEKELGSKSKKDLEAIGVEKFNALCRERVLDYVHEWEKIIPRLGRWVDMKNSYKTMDLSFMESVWWAFKELYNKDLVYEGFRSIYICPRCETTLSQSEVAEGYRDIKDLSAIAKFELDDVILNAAQRSEESGRRYQQPDPSSQAPQDDKVFVLAWTTTPWTLIGNVALAVGNDIVYSLIQKAKFKDSVENAKLKDNEKYLVAKSRIKDILKDEEYEIVNEFKGSELVGKKYKPLFDYYYKDENLENHSKGWKIYAGDFVTDIDGTGIVHIAPAFGDDDLKLGQANDLPFVQHVGMDGHIKPEAIDFAGLHVKPKDEEGKDREAHMLTDIEIIKSLSAHKNLFHKEKYEHSYPHCWRCDTPLINYATTSWFVNVAKIKSEMLDHAEPIHWSPEHIKKGRWGQWLQGARDWSISRQRFWASVMPIWRCQTQNSKLKTQNQCKNIKVIGSIKELEDLSGEKVTDLHKDVVDKITFPCEACGGTMRRIPDVLDTWFDSGSMPYAQVHYPFENKEKFEKNFPAEFIAEGQDQCRAWFYYLHVLATGLKQTHAFNNVIVNGIVLAEDGKKMSKKLKNYPDPTIMFDKYGADAMRYYLLSSPVMLSENINFSEKGVQEALRNINMILWNVYKFYEQYAGSKSDLGKQSPDNILDLWILAKLNELIEEVTKNMDAYNLPKSVRPIEAFINELSTWYLRRSRDRFKGEDEIDKNSALATMHQVLIELAKVMAPFMPFMAEVLWQEVTGKYFMDPNQSVHLERWPEPAPLEDASIIEKMHSARQLVEQILAARDSQGLKVRQPLSEAVINFELDEVFVRLVSEECNIQKITFSKEFPIGDHWFQFGENLKLNTYLDVDLKREGIKRELVRTINQIRKRMNLTINDRIKVSWNSQSEDIRTVFLLFNKELLQETLSAEIIEKEFGNDIENALMFDINGKKVVIGIAKN